MKNIIAIILITVSLNCFAQTPASPAQDSVVKLIREKMLINSALIDSTMKRVGEAMSKIKATTTVKDYELYYEAFEFFRQTMISVWLEENRKKKK